jgi:hypothetical protein|tara:strand:+ start:2638 stop:3276 length:639 start_codon:yes stop_codon:yes gene_type:complete
MADLVNARELFEKKVAESEQIVASVEALWQTAPIGSDVRKQITESQLAALYEMAFLALFGHWENFIEECMVRMLSGQGCTNYTPVFVAAPRSPTLTAARLRLLNGRPFLLWYDPVKSADKIAAHVSGSPLETVLRGSAMHIQNMAAVRHAIAHQSQDALASFKAVSLVMVGVEHAGPGALLRSQDHSDPLNPTRWLRRLTTDLRGLARSATS